MTILTVGAEGFYATIAAAVAAAQSGDTIEINAGTYVAQDVKLNTDLTIEAAGNGPVVVTDANYVSKGLFIVGNGSNTPNVTIEGLTLRGAHATRAGGNNGAGIRYQSGNLNVANDTFVNNQDGILATPGVWGTGSVTVQGSIFNHNGAGDGQSHNLYIGHVANFEISNSVVENASVGNEIKSRANNTEIVNNVIMDGPNGTASYSIDIPNGGNAIVQGNTIEQGPKSQNPWIMEYGVGGALQPGSLTVAGNLILNDESGGEGIWNATTIAATITGNETFGLGPTQFLSGPATQEGNTALATEPTVRAVPPGLKPTMTFLGGSTPGALTIYDSATDQTMDPPTGGPVAYEVDAGGTGTLNLTDFRVGVDSFQLGQGVTIAAESMVSGALTMNLSNSGTVLIGHFS